MPIHLICSRNVAAAFPAPSLLPVFPFDVTFLSSLARKAREKVVDDPPDARVELEMLIYLNFLLFETLVFNLNPSILHSS
jgi:hypothetical protein